MVDPADVLVGQLVQLDLDVVLGLQAVGQDLKLQDADGAYDDLFHTGVELLEDLDGTLLGDLQDALGELLPLHGVDLAESCEVLRREGRDALELHRLLRCAERVADGENARIKDADDIARVGLLDDLPLIRHHLRRLIQAELPPALDVGALNARLILAGADAHEGDPVAMRLVHVRLDLEDEGREEIVLHRIHHAGLRGPGQRGVSHLQEVLQEGLDAEVRQCGTEEHRSQISAGHPLHVQFIAGAVQKLDLLQQLVLVVLADGFAEVSIVHGDGVALHFLHAGVGCVEGGDLLRVAVVNALEILAAANRPVHRTGPDAQQILDLVRQGKGIPGLTVHLVDEGKDRNVAQRTYLEQLPRLRLDTLTGIDDHDRGVRRHQRTVGVLREVLMPRRIQDVDAEALVIELQNGRCDRNSTFLLDLHPVRDRVLSGLSSLDAAGKVDSAAVKQQLLGQGRLTGVRVADDGKGTSFSDLFKIR